MSNGLASSLTEVSRSATRARIARRVGSARGREGRAQAVGCMLQNPLVN